MDSDTTKQIRWGTLVQWVGNHREYNGYFEFLGFAFKRHWEVLFNGRCLIFMEVIKCSAKTEKGRDATYPVTCVESVDTVLGYCGYQSNLLKRRFVF